MIIGSQQEFFDEEFGIVDSDDADSKVRLKVDGGQSGECSVTVPAVDGGSVVVADGSGDVSISGNAEVSGGYVDMKKAGTNYIRVTGADRDLVLQVNDGGVYRNALVIDSSLLAKVSTYGDLYVGDDLTVGDDLEVNGKVNGDLVPGVTANLGDDSDYWDEVHYSSLCSHSIEDYKADSSAVNDILKIVPGDKSTYPKDCYREASDVRRERVVRELPMVEGKIKSVEVLEEFADGSRRIAETRAGGESININQVLALLIEHNKELERRVSELESGGSFRADLKIVTEADILMEFRF